MTGAAGSDGTGEATVDAAGGTGGAGGAAGEATADAASSNGADVGEDDTANEDSAPVVAADAAMPVSDDAGQTASGGPWGTPVPGGPKFAGATVMGTVKVSPGSTAGRVPDGFLGFSFEKTHMTDRFFTAANAPLIALFKLLGPGVVRIGANDVDHSSWQPDAKPVSGAPFPNTVGTGEVDDLAAFLKATGWKAIYGLDYKRGTPPNDAAEAGYVAGKLGDSLASFEIGNEIDRGPPTYSATVWQSFASAITAMAPGAHFAGPATDPRATGFAASFVHTQASKLVQLTHHYYVQGSRNMGAMLAGDPQLVSILQSIATSAADNHLTDGFRMAECNTFNGHGVAGASDVFASALWAMDFFFINAKHGSAGINFHGGRLGQDGGKPFLYAPIAEGNNGVTGVNPIFYGMLMMSVAGAGTVLDTTATVAGVNFTAYALAAGGGTTNVVLVNKDDTRGVKATVDVGGAFGSASVIYLEAPSLTATSGVTLAGAPVTAKGAWSPQPPWALTASGHSVDVLVPPASAALVHFIP
jgi:hypothetical protein